MGDITCRINECSGKAFWCKDKHFLTTAKCPAADMWTKNEINHALKSVIK
jgi:hypothetical protein